MGLVLKPFLGNRNGFFITKQIAFTSIQNERGLHDLQPSFYILNQKSLFQLPVAAILLILHHNTQLQQLITNLIRKGKVLVLLSLHAEV